jgi:hypothetical protein
MPNMEEIVPERFRVRYYREDNVFKILDTWHPAVKNLNLEDNPEIPSDSPSLKAISGEEVNVLIGELLKLGWLDKFVATKAESVQNVQRSKPLVDLVVEKITEITLDSGTRKEPHSSVAKDAISALKEIASRFNL